MSQSVVGGGGGEEEEEEKKEEGGEGSVQPVEVPCRLRGAPPPSGAEAGEGRRKQVEMKESTL